MTWITRRRNKAGPSSPNPNPNPTPKPKPKPNPSPNPNPNRNKAGPSSQTAFQRARGSDPEREAAVLRALPLNTSHGPPLVASLVDFAALDIAAQLATARATAVLVGVHGAGLANVLWARPGCHVVEVSYPKP